MTVHVSLENPSLVKVHIRGEVLRAEVDASKHLVHDHMQRHGKCHVLFILEPGFSNLQACVSWADIDVDTVIKQNIIRLAVVGDLRWRDNALLFLFNSMVPFQIEYFPADQEGFALAWLLE